MDVPVPILMYHKIARIPSGAMVKGHYVSPGLFARHIRMLKAMGYTTVPLDNLFQHGQSLPERPIVITFDDGYQNFFENALPVLKDAGYVSTVFLVANQLGGTNAWDVALGDVSEPLMDVDTIRKAAEQGTQFGSHTLDHADLAAADAEQAKAQIADSKAVLESKLGLPIHTFCYPYGRRNADTAQIVKDAGYRSACSTEKGINTATTDRYALRRINVRSDTWTPVLWLKLLRAARHGR